MEELLQTLPQQGQVLWIGVRPARREPVIAVQEAQLLIGSGLVGDRFRGRADSRRQVTLMQAEHLPVIASLLHVPEVLPEQLRRNILVKGINLLALKDRCFRLGSAVLEMTGLAHPCSRMEEIFGAGGYNAVRGHGGITAKVLEEGLVRLGDDVVALDRRARSQF